MPATWLDWMPAQGTPVYYMLRVAVITISVVVATRLLTWLIRRAMLSPRRLWTRRFSERRTTTLRALVGSIMNGIALLMILVLILGMFVQSSALFTALGLFSAGLGIGARPYVSDFLGGIVLLFEDQFVLGDKVEIGDRKVIGIVERVTLRTTHIRGEAGELWLVPNGDVRTIRNFSRGTWSQANIRLTVPTSALDEAMVVLQALSSVQHEDVLEAPEIISESGEIATDRTTLLLKVRARFGQAPLVRRWLLKELQARLAEHHIIDEHSPVQTDDSAA